MVYRIFVEKKAGLDNEAKGLLSEAKNLLGITLSTSLLMIPQKSITAVMFFDKK